MFEISIDFSEFDRKVAASKPALERDIEAAVKLATIEGRDVAKHGGWKDQTGELRRTIAITAYTWSGSTFWGEYRTQAPYAWFVNYDTQPHEIWPKAGYGAAKSSLQPGQTRRGRGKGPHEHVVGRGHALRWVDGSGQHFAGHVEHPGTTGFQFMEVSSREAKKELLSQLHRGFVHLRSVWAQ